MHANFQVSSSTGVGGGGGDRRKDGHETSRRFWHNPYKKFKFPPLPRSGGIMCSKVSPNVYAQSTPLKESSSKPGIMHINISLPC